MAEAVSAGVYLGEALGLAARQLEAAGIASPRREAFRLAADLLGIGPGMVALRLGEPLAESEAGRLAGAVERRAAGEPMPYVTGVAGFRTLTVGIDRRALIPRPETEGLVDRVLACIRDGVVLDVGTGSGCIALSLCVEGRFERVLAVDSSGPALGLARENAARVGAEVTFVRGDLVGGFAAASVDALVSNPPYISDEECRHLDRSVRDHEPMAALCGGPDGLGPTRRLLADALRVVRPGGMIALELASDRAAASAREAQERGWVEIAVEDDLFGRSRYLMARRRPE